MSGLWGSKMPRGVHPFPRSRCAARVGVFAANLIVPAWLGWAVTGDGGRAGMIAATVLTRVVRPFVVLRLTGRAVDRQIEQKVRERQNSEAQP
ncbi:hypothetical protein FTUN_5191 [Frigoriglobus tundricola]|uniref:Uncharacterized protein n=1 Tax=Frigoriglobus tundricola TaxID=2774151 RepID=A0A6M5YW45_9BACT|nr:hypothetical protein FTUN_5191 [Frigoriglobus tundricola]